MRLHIQLDDGSRRAAPRFLMAVTPEATIADLRASVATRLQRLVMGPAALYSITLCTEDGYRIDIQESDRVADLIATDSVILVRIETPHDPDLDLRALIGQIVLPQSSETADDALRRLCSALNSDNVERLREFLSDQLRRRHRLQILLGIRPDLLRRLLTEELVSAAVDQHDFRALCHAYEIAPGGSDQETVRALGRCPELRTQLGRLIRHRLTGLQQQHHQQQTSPHRKAVVVTEWTEAAIEALDDGQYDRVVRGLIADPERDEFRAFVRLAIETRFAARLAADPDLVAVLYGLVRDHRSTWAARMLGLLWRHSRTKALDATITELSQTVNDPIVRIHLDVTRS